MPRHFKYTSGSSQTNKRLNVSRHVPESFIEEITDSLEAGVVPEGLDIREDAKDVFESPEAYLESRKRVASRESRPVLFAFRFVEPLPRGARYVMRAYQEGEIMIRPGDPEETPDPVLEFTGYVTKDGDVHQSAVIAHH